MPRYVAFLRAINVGGHTVKMDRLRQLFSELGFVNVETFIASGNVIFDAAEKDTGRLESRTAGHLQGALGYAVATFVRTPAEVAAVAACRPFADAAGHALYIAFLADRPGAEAAQRLMAYRTAVDDFHVAGREVYWLCRQKMSESAFSGATLEKTLGLPATLRNVTTVQKLAAKVS